MFLDVEVHAIDTYINWHLLEMITDMTGCIRQQ